VKSKQLSFKTGKGGSSDWRHAIRTHLARAAEMVIKPGESEGGPDNKHRGADQLLFVIEGVGEAHINGHKRHLSFGTLLLIERGDMHEILNTGSVPLRTLNFYAPPAFKTNGARLPRGKK